MRFGLVTSTKRKRKAPDFPGAIYFLASGLRRFMGPRLPTPPAFESGIIVIAQTV